MLFNRILAFTTGGLAILGMAAIPLEVEASETRSSHSTVAQVVEDPEGAIDLDDATEETDAHEGIGAEPGPGGDYEETYGGGTRDADGTCELPPAALDSVDEECAIDLDDANSETDAHEGIGEEPDYYVDGEPDEDAMREDGMDTIYEDDYNYDGDNIDQEGAIDLEDATDETDAHEGIGEEPDYRN